VRYRVWFKDASDLEKIVLGKANVYWRDGRMNINRSLSTGKPLPDKPGFLARRVHAATLKSLVKRRMSFMILVPWYYELQTTRGGFVRPAEQLGSYFQVPLESTMNAGGPITWTVEIKPNPKPESGPKKSGEK
ncbi:MAG: hypothetical protein HY042_13440, partial [Spirochaetia bacterium]|nr:hypothetical protein [Spirochaetia bacterium]